MDKNNLSWEKYFMGIALLSAQRSKDPHTKVGACIVGEDYRILSIGYNGAPNGFEDKDFPWDKREGEFVETKYPYICHAELNAILNFKGHMKDLEYSTLYVTFFPCNTCAKMIIQSGICEIVYLEEYDHDNHKQESEASKRMFKKCGISFRKFDENIDIHLLYENTRSEKEKIEEKLKNNQVSIRSCWNCNPAHKHLKKSDSIITCPWCGKTYYEGKELCDFE